MNFDKRFFERFSQIIHKYAQREKCSAPVVEFFLQDGTKFEIKNIIMVREDWISFTIYDKTGCSTDVVVPIGQISRVVLYRDPQKSETIGFKI